MKIFEAANREPLVKKEAKKSLRAGNIGGSFPQTHQYQTMTIEKRSPLAQNFGNIKIVWENFSSKFLPETNSSL